LSGLSAAALAAELDDAAALGAGWIRSDLGWNDVQSQSSTNYDWSRFDRIVAAASARNMTVLPILTYTPAWARPAGCTSPKCAPARPAKFAAFARASALRYSPQGVHTWEIWNEPNLVSFWQPSPAPAAYARLVELTAASIRGVDSGSTIVSGGLASTDTVGGNISQLDFMTAFCNQGAQFVDGIGYHPYSYPVPPGYDAPWNAWAKMANTSPSFESILTACGAAAKKIWITEYGAPTNGPGPLATAPGYGLGSRPDHVDESLQATMATDSVRLARAAPHVAALFWYSYKDLGTNAGDRENYFGLRRFDGSPKPAYDALKAAIAAG